MTRPPDRRSQGPDPYGGGRSGLGGGSRGGGEPVRMPKPNDIEYFVEADRRRPNVTLVNEQAAGLAESIRDTPASQIRRFYGDVVAISRRVELSDEAICTQMALLKAKAAYARGRKQIPQELFQFFVDHAAAVKDRTSYDAFRRVFEAVIAYHKFYEIKRPGN